MKNIKYIISLFLLVGFLGCSEDESNVDLSGIAAPSDISALFTITQDNTGKVTIRPNSTGTTSYNVDFGDSSTPATIAAGETAIHNYAEGEYVVKITAIGVSGLETVYTQPLTVTFIAPENVVVTIAPQNGNPYKINVSAVADYETFFEVYWGEDPTAAPEQFNEGQTISHTYAAVGTYEVRVVALSGGVATTEYTQNVTVYDPILLPVNFESPTLNYAFGDFGGVFTSVVANPDPTGENTSTKVAKLTKNPGAEIWAGTTLLLDQPIDFSTIHHMSLKSYAPVAGAVIKLKLENMSDANINIEVDAVTTVANQWETLTYDFSGINNANNYQRVVIFCDYGNNGNGADYYFDDIQQISVSLPLTFENSVLNYNFVNFGEAYTSVVSNPVPGGINTSSKVGQLVKNAGAQTWAGSFITMAEPIDFSTMHKIKVKVWSPQAGVIVLLKLENTNDTSINMEVQATTTVANGWEELTFDFSGIDNSNNYQNVVIFFDFNVPGNGATYYFDDIHLSN